jgi:hypothetical protein
MLWRGENVIINKNDAQKLEAAQMRFLRPLLRLTNLDRQRNLDICNRLKVDNIKLYQKKWLDHLERMDRSCLPRLALQYQPGTAGYGKTKTKMERAITPWGLKEQVSRPKPWLCSLWWYVITINNKWVCREKIIYNYKCSRSGNGWESMVYDILFKLWYK